MALVRTVCVYCGSGFGKNPAFKEAAQQLGTALAQAGMSLVYGGGDVGLMGTVARAVLESGGHVTGIIPDFLQARENMLDAVDETIVVPDMHTRKRLMFERSDAFVTLPGGIGTLEELVEQLTGRSSDDTRSRSCSSQWMTSGRPCSACSTTCATTASSATGWT